MSNIAMQGGATGTGTVTLLAPVTSTDRTLTLPDATDTVAGIAATQTLTNKTLTTPVISSLSSAAATALTLQSAGTTAVTIDTSQNFLVGKTTGAYGTAGVALSNAGSDFTASGADVVRVNRLQDGILMRFASNSASQGSISIAGSTTTYSTSSDYRLKEAVTPMTGALAKVALLKPCTYKWKVDGSDGQGFIAHELAEVEAGCVTGAKDAVDEEGNPQYQGIDTSFLVATLTAAIQELKAIVDAQGAEIAALKGAQA